MSERKVTNNGNFYAAPPANKAVTNGFRINSIQQKIQIQLQKQEEETRRFNEMMQEAQLVKVLYTGQPAPQMHPHLHQHPGNHAQQHPVAHTSRGAQHLVPSYPSYRGGSLPNVNQMVNQAAGIDLQNALDSLEMLRTDRDLSPRGVRHPSPTPSSAHVRRHFSPTKRPMEYDANRMPHSYLLPPEHNSHLTKRAISDPLLHQSANPHMDSYTNQQAPHPATFAPNRRSPVPDKSSDPQNYLWNDPMKGMYRPKQNDIPGASSFSEHDAHMAQQHQHLLSPTSNQPSSSTNPTSGSLPDLTNPSMNFPSMVTPLDPEDTQGSQVFSLSNANQSMSMANQVRTPNSHSSSTSPQNMRRMRGPDSNGPSGGPRKSPHSSPNLPYNPYHPVHNVNNQAFVSYRSNSSSPGVQPDHLGMMHAAGSNPSSPANSTGMPQYVNDPLYLDMQQTVQQKLQHITMDHSGMADQFSLYGHFNTDFMRYHNNDPSQIPDIVFTAAPGMDDGSQRTDCSGMHHQNSSASSANSHPFQNISPPGVNDSYSAQNFSQESVDLLDMFKLDQDALSMLNDVTLGHVVDPETEEQFRLDNNIH